MRKVWFVTTAVLALAACNENVEPAATTGTPATMATTNAKVEPVPTETVKPPRPSAPRISPSPAPRCGPWKSEPPRPGQWTIRLDDIRDACGASKVAPFVGRQDRPTTRADLAKAVGHENIRWIGPDDMVTMDFNEKRLNVLLDQTKRLITGARCG